MNRTLTNLLLLGALALLGLVAWFEPGREAPAEPPRILNIDPAAVTTLRIEQAGADAIVLEREGGRWWMRQPVAVAARDQHLDEMLTRLAEARSLGTFAADAGERGRYELAKPALRLTADGDTLAFGGTTPIDGRRYVLVGEELHTISDRLYHRLSGGYAAFVSDRLLPERAPLAVLELPGLTLRRDEGHWRAEPQLEGHSADAVAALVEGWRAARAVEVIPGADEAVEQVRITRAGEEHPIVFHILRRGPDLLLARPDLGITYRLFPPAADDLLTLATE